MLYTDGMCQILCGDVMTQLATIEAQSVQTCVTSPPYWGLRDYGVGGQLGLEKTLEEYVAKMVAVFREVRRVLKDDGTLWLNLGDSYAGSGKGRNGDGRHSQGTHWKQSTNRGAVSGIIRSNQETPELKPKDLVGIPWRIAFALQQPHIKPTCVKAEVDRAWLAAMFDGEGCIGIRRFDSYREEKQQVYQDGFVIYTVVTNNDIELLERCVALTGFGKPSLFGTSRTPCRRVSPIGLRRAMSIFFS